MGSKNMGHKETKKAKKDSKKPMTSAGSMEAPPPVEVIRRGKKDRSEEE
jgi:hypothetical protein